MTARRVPDYFVEAAHAGVLDDPRVTDSQRAELRADDAAIFARHPARAFVGEVERRLGASRSPARATSRVNVALGALGCASLAAVALTVTFSSHAPEESADFGRAQLSAGERAKGTARPQLEVHRVVDGKAEELADGDEARPGDVIQLAIASSDAKHAVVVSLDGRGDVTLHFPEDIAGSTALAPHSTVALAHSFELDDAPKLERFFLVTSEHEIDPRVVVDAAKRIDREHADAAPLDLALAQRSLLLRKETR